MAGLKLDDAVRQSKGKTVDFHEAMTAAHAFRALAEQYAHIGKIEAAVDCLDSAQVLTKKFVAAALVSRE